MYGLKVLRSYNPFSPFSQKAGGFKTFKRSFSNDRGIRDEYTPNTFPRLGTYCF
jgi:hypothetical protein